MQGEADVAAEPAQRHHGHRQLRGAGGDPGRHGVGGERCVLLRGAGVGDHHAQGAVEGPDRVPDHLQDDGGGLHSSTSQLNLSRF